MLISFISSADGKLAVKGEFRLNLSNQHALTQVLFVLRLQGEDSLIKDLAYQTEILRDGESTSILLVYDSIVLDLESRYMIVVFVRSLLADEQNLIIKDSFPFSLKELNKKIYLSINRPPKAIE